MAESSWLIVAGVGLVTGFFVGAKAYSVFNAARPPEERGSTRVTWQELAFGLGFLVFFAVSMRVTFWLLALLRK